MRGIGIRVQCAFDDGSVAVTDQENPEASVPKEDQPEEPGQNTNEEKRYYDDDASPAYPLMLVEAAPADWPTEVVAMAWGVRRHSTER